MGTEQKVIKGSFEKVVDEFMRQVNIKVLFQMQLEDILKEN